MGGRTGCYLGPAPRIDALAVRSPLSRLASLALTLACAIALGAPAVVSAGVEPPGAPEPLRALEIARGALSANPPGAQGGAGSRDATAALRDLAVALPALRGADRRRAHELLDRPTDPDDRDYFGPEAAESPICDARFCVHWTSRPSNAPSSPRFVDEVVAATDRSFAIENGALGWRRPKSDGARGRVGGLGGQGQVDVYITDLGPRLYGFATPDPGQKGTRRFAYLVLDNDYVGFPSPPLASMKVTVAHEYNHVLHFNYDTLEDLWMFEATATWMEQQVYPAINDYLNYLPTFAQHPESPLTGREKVYADGVWNHWLEARLGARVVRDAWAESPSVRPVHDSVASYDSSIKRSGGRSFSREFAKFAAVTAEWSSSGAFPDARAYPDMRRRGKLGERPLRMRLDNTAYRLLHVPSRSRGPLSITLVAQRGIRSSIALVGRDGKRGSGEVRIASRFLDRGGRATVRLAHPSRYERLTAVVTNADGRGRSGHRRADDSRYTLRLRK